MLDLFAEPRLNHQTAVLGGVLAPACGQLLRDFFAERRTQQRAERETAVAETVETIPTGEVRELGTPDEPEAAA